MNEPVKKLEINLKIFILITLSVLFLFFYTSDICAEQKTDNKVRVGFCYFSGFNEVDKNGNYSGYGYEYYQEIARYTGWEYEFVVAPLSECMEMLKNGEIDIMGHQRYTKERQEIYDYADLSAGTIYTVIYARTDDDRYLYEDYESFDGMTVGVMSNSVLDQVTKKYTDENNFSVNYVYYGGQEELIDALDNKEVDAIATTILKKSDNRRMIAKFSPAPFYFITTKGNANVLDKLNYAITQIKLFNPSFEYQLNSKYFMETEKAEFIYTKKELELIEKMSPIRVAYVKDRAPIEFYDEKSKKFSGISADIFEYISDVTGLKFEYIRSENVEQALKMIKNNEVDLLASINREYDVADLYDFDISNTYLDVPYLIIKPKNISEKGTPNVVLSKSLAYTSFAESMGNAVYKNNFDDCLDDLLRGKADITYANTYIANKSLSESNYSKLSVTTLAAYSNENCIAVSRLNDPLLLSILNKAIYFMPTEKINDIIVSNTIKPEVLTFANLFYQNRAKIVAFFLIIFILVTLTLCYIIFLKNKNNKEIKKMISVDSLTGYWSFNKFRQEAQKMLDIENKPQYALLYIDINKFKYINDTFGYAVGDKILCEFSDTLYEFINHGEIFARVSADKFVMLLKYKDKHSFDMRLKNLDEVIIKISHNPNENYRYVVVTGVYVLQNNDNNITAIIDWANIAKETAVDFHKNLFVYYDEKIVTDIKHKRKIEERMEYALETGEFIPYLQPKFDTFTEQIVGAEALVRWQHLELGMISPNDFIPTFENNGFVVVLDLYMFEKVCQIMRSWMDEGKEIVPISCNFSRKHMMDDNFPQKLEFLTKKYRVPTKYLEIEITESVAMDELGRILKQILKLKALGFILAIDDFGTGYSSLGILKNLPMDVLKLDKDFLQRGTVDIKEKTVLQGVVRIAHDLKMTVVCEGVETQDQVDMLKEIGCHLAQGFLYARPMPVEKFEEIFYEDKTSEIKS